MISLLCGIQENEEQQTHRYKEQIGGFRGGGSQWAEVGKGSQNVHTSNYKVSQSWGRNVQQGDCSE